MARTYIKFLLPVFLACCINSLEAQGRKPSKVKPSDVFTIIDAKGLIRRCTVKKGKGQFVVQKGKNSYMLGAEKLASLKREAEENKSPKIKRKLKTFKKEMKAGKAACQSLGSSSLKPLSRVLTRSDIALLLERAGFGLGPEEEDLVQLGLTQGLEALVDRIMQEQDETPGLLDRVVDRLDDQLGSTSTQTPGGQRKAILDLWMHTKNPYAEKMAMFLLSVWTVSGEVIEDETFRGAFWDYYQRLRTYAYDSTDVSALALEVTVDPLMLIYLNNELNVKGNPNENYARELMELFTLGPTDLNNNPNYTESALDGSGDIAVAAKMLTGWKVELDYDYLVLRATDEDFALRHESGPHTMFKGKSYSFTGDDWEDLVRGIFTHHPEVKNYYAKEILKEYLTATPPAPLVKAFGQVIAANQYRLRPAMKTLFMSEAFYDASYTDTVPSSPYEMIARVVRVLGLQGAVNLDNLHYEIRRLGFMPNLSPSVFWYPQDTWNSSTAILEKANTLATIFGDRTSQNNAGWSPQLVLPVGSVTNDELLEHVLHKLNLSALNAGQKDVVNAFLSTERQYNGVYVPFAYDNTDPDHQRSKGLGLYYLLMLSPTFQMH